MPLHLFCSRYPLIHSAVVVSTNAVPPKDCSFVHQIDEGPNGEGRRAISTADEIAHHTILQGSLFEVDAVRRHLMRQGETG